MNPDKLFDYLDGKLSPADRQELEEKLMSDEQLRRQFQVAREIHRSGRDSREVLPPIEDPETLARGGRLGRQIATAAIVLVFLNVVGGLAVITWKQQKPRDETAKEAEIRRQLANSLGAAAQNAMPTPSLTGDDIQVTAPRDQWDDVAEKIIAGAEAFGGTARRALPDESALVILADIPASRESYFRQAVTSATRITPMPAIGVGPQVEAIRPDKPTSVQIRITEAAR